SKQRQRRDVYEYHFLVTLEIALLERTAIAESGVIDQDIDVEFLAIKPLQEDLQLVKISEINFSSVNKKLRILSLQFTSQFDQPFIAPRYQNHRARTTGELARKFAPNASRRACDQRITIVEFH